MDAFPRSVCSLPPCGGELERGGPRVRGLWLTPLPNPPPQGVGQSHVTRRCRFQLNRIANEAESNVERSRCFRSVSPNFLPHAIALPGGGGSARIERSEMRAGVG